MDFLLHLALLAGGACWLIFLVVSPAGTTVTTATLACGYVGSSGGFLGTVAGLAVGFVLGWLVVGAFSTVKSGLVWVAKRLPDIPESEEREIEQRPLPPKPLLRQAAEGLLALAGAVVFLLGAGMAAAAMSPENMPNMSTALRVALGLAGVAVTIAYARLLLWLYGTPARRSPQTNATSADSAPAPPSAPVS